MADWRVRVPAPQTLELQLPSDMMSYATDDVRFLAPVFVALANRWTCSFVVLHVWGLAVAFLTFWFAQQLACRVVSSDFVSNRLTVLFSTD
jgi:hypothetical protein